MPFAFPRIYLCDYFATWRRITVFKHSSQEEVSFVFVFQCRKFAEKSRQIHPVWEMATMDIMLNRRNVCACVLAKSTEYSAFESGAITMMVERSRQCV